ncbi:MAG: TIGR03118 family protein [Deltaproteobacteria bacterium]|nr:TIGR03118 family protein [Deltaproteobacteria bacterium]
MKTLKLALLTAFVLGGCDNNDLDDRNIGDDDDGGGTTQVAAGFTRVDLVSNLPDVALHQDANLVNAWGITTGPGGFWIANNGTGVLSVFDADGNAAPLNDTITLEPGITGIARNTTQGFLVPCGPDMTPLPADFLVASETGKVWAVSLAAPATAKVVVDRSGENAVFKGIAIATDGQGNTLILVTDFHNHRVDVFDTTFNFVATTGFVDTTVPTDFSPFNVAVFDGQVFVTFAQKEPNGDDELHGAGLGLIDVFDVGGRFVQRLTTGGLLNAPWGMAMAPAGFTGGAAALLVGNFGDGRLTFIEPTTGRQVGQVLDPNDNAVVIDGLWGITFGDDTEAGSSDVLYFASGPDDEVNGVYGRLEVNFVEVTTTD